jgi:hypothetical protein
MDESPRKKVTVWLKPDIVSRMDGWLEANNCKSRGEFTEKALRFYMGYLATKMYLNTSPRHWWIHCAASLRTMLTVCAHSSSGGVWS